MKNDVKFIKTVIEFFLIAVLFLSSFLFVRFQVKSLSKEKLVLTNKLITKKNLLTAKEVELQKLSSANTIINRARLELGLVRAKKEIDNINIDKKILEMLEYKVNAKYE